MDRPSRHNGDMVGPKVYFYNINIKLHTIRNNRMLPDFVPRTLDRDLSREHARNY